MTVSATQIRAAEAKGLINVAGLAKACDRYSFPFYLGCTILDKETDGRNIFGHDKGGAFSDPTGKNIEVTEARYREFRKLIDGGMTSNGVGPFQITWKGYFPDAEKRGFKLWVPADNIAYGIGFILKPSLAANLAKGQPLEKAFWNTAKAYNGNDSYADDAVAKMPGWLAAVGDTDTKPPEEPPVAERIPFRGEGLTCSCVVESLPWVELDMIVRGIVTQSIDLKQLGYRDDVSASAGTHHAGGCTDVAQRSAAAIDVWRRWGWTMQDRGPWFPDAPHAHGWPYGCPHLSDAAKDQNRDWNNRRNGLVNNEPVIGRWPVDTWQEALKKGKARMADLAKDIANELVNELVREAPRVAKAFLSADVIPSGKDESNPKNLTQVPATFIKGDHDLLVDIREALKKLAAKP